MGWSARDGRSNTERLSSAFGILKIEMQKDFSLFTLSSMNKALLSMHDGAHHQLHMRAVSNEAKKQVLSPNLCDCTTIESSDV